MQIKSAPIGNVMVILQIAGTGGHVQLIELPDYRTARHAKR